MNSSSVSRFISLLDDPNTELKVFALRQLIDLVDEFFYEISEAIEKLVILHADKSFVQYKLAALLISQVYFHLGLLDDSLTYAVNAEELFDINSRTEYVETIIGKYIDYYPLLMCAIDDSGCQDVLHTPLYKIWNNLIERLFKRCLDCGEFKIAVCLALDTRRLDVLTIAVTNSNNILDMLTYAYKVSTNLIQKSAFKIEVMRCLANMYSKNVWPNTDYFSWCQCLIFMNDALEVGKMLVWLILLGTQQTELRSYQLAFDLCESATQEFLERVTRELKRRGNMYYFLRTKDRHNLRNQMPKLLTILSGNLSVKLHSQFLKCSNKTDTQILDKTMQMQRKSHSHTGTVIANGFMHSGTTDDRFLRDNLQWLEKTTNWEETSAVASLGVINRGHIKGFLQLIQKYKDDIIVSESGYIKSGFLYALGLIHANLGGEVLDYLVDQLKNAESEEIRHGGCLGLGLAAMGTNREDLYQLLKSQLHLDEACTGEAAGIAMGMVMLGSNNKSAIEDMVSYAQKSQHEKILRGLSVGIALVMYGRFEEANALIDRLEVSSNAILRRSAMYTAAMAYCGTGHKNVLRKLLRVAISDVDDDVRRAALTGLGFLLFNTPEYCPNLVSLLTKSYNPHVRYGATMALGIACAGTGMEDALVLLKPIIESDKEDFVRQGAFIASAMILMQHNERTCPQVNFFRTSYADTIENKYENEISKFGAILAQGIIDAGGRNVTLSLQTRTGHTNMLSVVGTLMFTQFCYCVPLAHCLSLAFTPTCLIALTSDLRLAKLNFKSNVKPGLFAYPPPLKDKKEEKKIQVKVAPISQTKRKEDKKREKSDEEMAVDAKLEDKSKMEIETKEKQLNSTFEILRNPARVLNKQLGFMSINEATRYVPVKDVSLGGIIMVQDLRYSQIPTWMMVEV